ncbi:ATP-binding cassette domain-containing protein [Anderseniella sp. Alg231-50]|uniref:ATP-binding cassette domain-containing protein n=1 Tax=Anderseniella sp. Alg231-50 TaxID=1922226 RepID=UPI000D559D36
MAETMLDIQGLKKSFGGVVATDSVTLGVEAGELHAIIGPNGAGKTTLIAQLSGDLTPDAGHVVFNGKDITTVPTHRRSHFGLARSFQITSVFMGLSVIDNVALAVQAHDGHSFRFWQPATTQARLRKPALEVLEKVGLANRAGTIASAMSHGERRQLEIAMALATDPSFLLLDEPMAGMGVEESAAMVSILRSLKGEKTILLVEHDMDAVFALADRISVLVYGRIIATGKPEDIRKNADVRSAYLGEV